LNPQKWTFVEPPQSIVRRSGYFVEKDTKIPLILCDYYEKDDNGLWKPFHGKLPDGTIVEGGIRKGHSTIDAEQIEDSHSVIAISEDGNAQDPADPNIETDNMDSGEPLTTTGEL
jgi:hypothetical protein